MDVLFVFSHLGLLLTVCLSLQLVFYCVGVLFVGGLFVVVVGLLLCGFVCCLVGVLFLGGLFLDGLFVVVVGLFYEFVCEAVGLVW